MFQGCVVGVFDQNEREVELRPKEPRWAVSGGLLVRGVGEGEGN